MDLAASTVSSIECGTRWQRAGVQVGDNESFLRNFGFSSTVLVLPGVLVTGVVLVTGGHHLSPVWRSQTRTASYELPFKTKTSHRTAISFSVWSHFLCVELS